MKLNLSPCLLNFFEKDIKDKITDKKDQGIKIRNGHILTLKFDKDFRTKQDAILFVTKYMQIHPNFSELYLWSGEHWFIICKGCKRATIFKFVSKNLQINEGAYYSRIRAYD